VSVDLARLRRGLGPATALYLAIPVAIFGLGYLRPGYALLFSAALAASLVPALRGARARPAAAERSAPTWALLAALLPIALGVAAGPDLLQGLVPAGLAAWPQVRFAAVQHPLEVQLERARRRHERWPWDRASRPTVVRKHYAWAHEYAEAKAIPIYTSFLEALDAALDEASASAKRA
jgi:hypothetical protein